jgi:hypothetical protein
MLRAEARGQGFTHEPSHNVQQQICIGWLFEKCIRPMARPRLTIICHACQHDYRQGRVLLGQPVEDVKARDARQIEIKNQ